MYYIFFLLFLSCFHKNHQNFYSKYSGHISCNTTDAIIGSGGYIRYKNNNYFITARHVLEHSSCSEYYYCNSDNICNEIKFYYAVDNNEIVYDLALIPLTGKRKGVKMKFFNPKILDEVRFTGHPWGESKEWVSEGTIAYIDESIFAVNSFAAPGSSGSLVFYNKKPVGIVVAIVNTPYGFNTNRVIVLYFKKEVMVELMQ